MATLPTIPKGDVILADPPRRLRSMGVLRQKIDGVEMRLHRWRSADGMIVAASIDADEHDRPELHVSVSYAHKDPQPQELQAVQSAFFPNVDVTVQRLTPHCFALIPKPNPDTVA